MPVLNDAQDLYLGNQQVTKVYAGTNLVWQSTVKPNTISGLVTWLDAKDYEIPGAWVNKAFGGPAVTFVGSPHPKVSTTLQNGMPVVRFTTSEGRLRSTWPYPPDDWTLLYLMRYIGPGAGRAFSVQYPPSNLLVGFHTTASDAAYFNGGWVYGPRGGGYFPPTPGPWRMYEADSDSVGNGQGFFIDGTAYGRYVGQVGQGFYNGWALSGYDANATQETMDFEVAELLIFNRRLSNTERKQMEDYLQFKWFVYHSPPPGPTDVAGLGLWLEADKITGLSDGAVVNSWPELSNGYQVTPISNAPVWRQSGIGGKPAVEFIASPPKRMTIKNWGTAVSGKSEYTLFQVLSQNEFGSYPVITTAPYYTVWSWLTEWAPNPSGGVYWGQGGGRYTMFHSAVQAGVPVLLTYSLHPTLGPKFYLNGIQITDFETAGGGMQQQVPSIGTDVILGGYYDVNQSLGLTGKVSAMLWYDHFLVDAERQKVETYLKTKYGL